ncbi:hypothetical protein [Phaffia rhodozyma]|uniref:Uncharacterized protein n=1 Tax=Phaffia rhodozyma TaxID=264483 RepID=A0A0F7SHP1_PHARH|nr:hypothetical protein [Phaffia rhodozyma]
MDILTSSPEQEKESPWADAPSSPPSPTVRLEQFPSQLDFSPVSLQLDQPESDGQQPSPTTEPTRDSASSPLKPADSSSFTIPPPSNSFPTDGFNDDDDDGFDSFDEESAPVPVGSNPNNGFPTDDDFGDFGDFDEGADGGFGDMADGGFDQVQDEGFGDFDKEVETAPVHVPPPPSIPSLRLAPFPDLQTLRFSLERIISPIYPNIDPEVSMTGEDVRDVAGLSQVLVDEKSRALYNSLVDPVPLRPLDWTRSRVRREHLISLGVPVNLDEVATSRQPTLPPLMIKTRLANSAHLNQHSNQPMRPQSTPPGDKLYSGPKRANTIGHPHHNASSSHSSPTSLDVPRRAGSTNQGVRSGGTSPYRTAGGVVGPGSDVDLGAKGRKAKTYGLGNMPEVGWETMEELCLMESDSLSLLSLDKLESLQTELSTRSSQASNLLSYLLQLRDAQQDESIVSNGMIAELVMSAQKAALAGRAGTAGGVNGNGSGGGGGWRRSVVGGSRGG